MLFHISICSNYHYIRFSSTRQPTFHEEQCSCEQVKAAIEAGKTSSLLVIATENNPDVGLSKRREAIAERNDTERFLTKETVKVLTKNTAL